MDDRHLTRVVVIDIVLLLLVKLLLLLLLLLVWLLLLAVMLLLLLLLVCGESLSLFPQLRGVLVLPGRAVLPLSHQAAEVPLAAVHLRISSSTREPVLLACLAEDVVVVLLFADDGDGVVGDVIVVTSGLAVLPGRQFRRRGVWAGRPGRVCGRDGRRWAAFGGRVVLVGGRHEAVHAGAEEEKRGVKVTMAGSHWVRGYYGNFGEW